MWLHSSPHFRWKNILKGPLHPPPPPCSQQVIILPLYNCPSAQWLVMPPWQNLKGSRLKIALLKLLADCYFQQSGSPCAPVSSCCGMAGEGKLQRKSRTTQAEAGRSSRANLLWQDEPCCHQHLWSYWCDPALAETNRVNQGHEGDGLLISTPYCCKGCLLVAFSLWESSAVLIVLQLVN